MPMAERRRLNLSLNLSVPHQREAWKLLRAIPAGQRTDAVCRAVCQRLEWESLLEAVRQILREELKNISVISTTESTQQQAGDVDENVLGFLLSLQNDGGDK